ncbi:hypothetical protein Tco_1407476 [Tanacetum coccineum]
MKTLFCEPTVSSLNDNKFDFRISFDESGDEDYTVVFDKNSLSYKIISANDLKADSKNDNEKVNMALFPSPELSVSCIDDLDFFKDFENEFPAIVYNDALTSKSDFLTEPTLCPQHIDEFDLKDETSLSEYDEEEQNVLYFNDLFPFNIIYPGDSKSDKDNDDHEIDIKQSLGGNVINTDDGAYAHGYQCGVSWGMDTAYRLPVQFLVIMEYLIKISKKARIMELKRRHLKINCSDILYAVSIKEDTVYPCKHFTDYHEGLKTQYAVSRSLYTPYPRVGGFKGWVQGVECTLTFFCHLYVTDAGEGAGTSGMRPRLLDFVLSLDEDIVVYASQKALKLLPNVSKYIYELTALKGVAKGAPVQRKTLKHMDYEVDLDSRPISDAPDVVLYYLRLACEGPEALEENIVQTRRGDKQGIGNHHPGFGGAKYAPESVEVS